MAETSLGRASLSVTADLGGFTTALDQAAQKTNQLTTTNDAMAESANKVTTATEHQTKALQALQDEAKKNPALKRQEIKPPTVQKVSLGIKDYIGIGAAVTAFNKITDMVTGAISAVVKFGASVVDAGAKFQQVDIRLQALTGSKTLAKGLQDIMKSGPSASFEALAESATRLSALKFDAKSVEILTRQFNQLGIALGNPEKIMNLIVDKIGDMAADGMATFPALSKLAEEGIPVWAALSDRLTRTTGNLVTVAQAQEMVKDGLVQVGEAAAAIGDAASMNGMAEMMKKNANSFYGVWSTVTNNLQVLFQKVGGFFVEGFSLVSLSDGITKLFDSIGKKMDELRPFFTKIGVFISSVMDIAQGAITDFFDAWINKQHEFDLESVLKSAKLAAIDFSLVVMDMAKVIVNALMDVAKKFEDVDAIARKSNKFWTWIKGNFSAQAQMELKAMDAIDQAIQEKNAKNQQPNKGQQVDNFFKTQTDRLNAVKSQIENEKINAEIDLYLNLMLGDPKQKALDELKPKLDGVGDAAKKAAEKMEGLNKAFNKDIKREEPKLSEKFLAENLTALQIYEKEIVRLNQMLAEGAQGELAFALGSAAAIKKLKEATGLGEIKFAAAITQGSAEDFKATLDAQNNSVDVQQQIRELMQSARDLQEEQLKAQKEIAAAIKAQKPPKPVNVIGG